MGPAKWANQLQTRITTSTIPHVSPPVVWLHVAKRGIDTALSGHGVGAGGEELRHHRRLEALLHQTEGGPQT